MRSRLLWIFLFSAAAASPAAQPAGRHTMAPPASYVPDVPPWPSQTDSELRDLIERLMVDRGALARRFSTPQAPERRAVIGEFYRAWRSRLDRVPFEKLGQEGRVDYVLLRNRLEHELKLLDREGKMQAEMAPLVPFAAAIAKLHEDRRRMEDVDQRAAAALLARMADEIDATRANVEAGLGKESPAGAIKTTRIVALRAANAIGDLKRTLEQWFTYHDGYDPLFSWWARDPYKRVDAALTASAKVLRERVVGYREGEDEPIVGDPIGRQGIVEDLEAELIPYSPEELVAIAKKEYAWCEAEMKKASREMGYGDEWKKALEKVKNLHVEPGKQPALIRELAHEAVDFVERRDLVTVPPLAKDIWRIEMMPPAQQKVSPFFLGGEVILVSYPTDAMEHDDKLMSMRGNNRHFSRATVQHELIPGHHLQGFMNDRYNSHRRAFGTPFWTEGWALYWEMLLWDLGFPQSPEDRVGMLFWRMHRTARIIFSLGFHLGTMTPQECIDFLVDRVGHERANAEGEVRRSFNGSYSPLYQVAYMIGGLQFRALHRELVGAGKLTNRDFHDTILKQGRMPVEMVRASLVKVPLTREYKAGWKFYQDAGSQVSESRIQNPESRRRARRSGAANSDITGEAARLIEVLTLGPGAAVADIGAGSGEMTVAVARQLGAGSRVYGTDINKDRLREIRQASDAAGLKNVLVLEGHADRTNLPDGCCDAVFGRHVYHHFGDPPTMNASIRQSLKPGGRFAVLDFVPDKTPDGTVPPGQRASGEMHGVMAETVVQELRAAGFDDVQIVTREWPGGLFLVLARNP